MKKARIVINVLIGISLFFQLANYSAALQGKIKHGTPTEGNLHIAAKIVYYFVVNLYWIPILVLFFISRSIKRRLAKIKNTDNADIDNIGVN